eukprot:366239-Chlamydomonas_euryale.AAC.27
MHVGLRAPPSARGCAPLAGPSSSAAGCRGRALPLRASSESAEASARPAPLLSRRGLAAGLAASLVLASGGAMVPRPAGAEPPVPFLKSTGGRCDGTRALPHWAKCRSGLAEGSARGADTRAEARKGRGGWRARARSPGVVHAVAVGQVIRAWRALRACCGTQLSMPVTEAKHPGRASRRPLKSVGHEEWGRRWAGAMPSPGEKLPAHVERGWTAAVPFVSTSAHGLATPNQRLRRIPLRGPVQRTDAEAAAEDWASTPA